MINVYFTILFLTTVETAVKHKDITTNIINNLIFKNSHNIPQHTLLLKQDL